MKTIKTIKNLILITIVLSIVSCSKDNDIPIKEKFDDGIFVSCEGNFMSANGSLSFIFEDGSVENGIFESVNGFPLGDVVQSISIIDTLAYIVVNNSGKVVVADAGTMEFVANIEGVGLPRYIVKAGEEQAYITDQNGKVHVLDLNSNQVTNSISVGYAPQQLKVIDNFAYVANSGWGSGNTVSVIDISTNHLTNTITVADNPADLVSDGNYLWVLSSGNTIWNSDYTAIVGHTLGALTAINTTSQTIEKIIDFPEGQHPSGLDYYWDKLYFKNGGSIFSQSVYSTQLDSNVIASGSYYGQISIYDGHLYAADALDYSQNGLVYEYSLNGELENTFNVGIIPSNFGY